MTAHDSDGSAEGGGPTPIALHNLATWARVTAGTDRRDYRRKAHPIDAGRLLRAIAPRLDDAIFVVGAARSGTTFLGTCLAALPGVGYHHEPVATKAAARYVHQGLWGERRSRAFFRAVFGWLTRIHLDGHLRFAAKNPTDSFIVPFLARTFPRSQFIHIVRDGRDAALSDSRKPWLVAASAGSGRREEGGYLCGPYPRFWVEPERRDEFSRCSDIRRCAWAWRRYVEAALRDGPALGPDRYLEVRYETLVGDPARQGARLLDFLRVGEAPARRAFLDAAARADGKSIGGWRRSLTPAQIGEIEAEAGPLLRQLGYEG